MLEVFPIHRSRIGGDLRPSGGRVLLSDKLIEDYQYDELALQRSMLLQHSTTEIPFFVEAVVAMGRHLTD